LAKPKVRFEIERQEMRENARSRGPSRERQISSDLPGSGAHLQYAKNVENSKFDEKMEMHPKYLAQQAAPLSP